MSLYFRPEKAVLGDVIPYYDNGVFKPFYLRNYRANRDDIVAQLSRQKSKIFIMN